jgi:hypothetical protein
MPHPLWRPDNQIIIVFLILTFYLIFFAGFADIGKAEGLSGTVCRRYHIGADIVTANIGNIGGPAVSGTALLGFLPT